MQVNGFLGTVGARLEELNIKIPDYVAPAANYVPYVITGNLAFISGQVALQDGKIVYAGKLGDQFTVEDGQKAARICALNILSQLKQACGGDLDRVKRCVKLGVFVNSTSDFIDQHKVGNGASDLIVEIFGDKGKHARAAIGCSSLPRGTAVEIEAVFELE